jgi:hypothetical protein
MRGPATLPLPFRRHILTELWQLLRLNPSKEQTLSIDMTSQPTTGHNFLTSQIVRYTNISRPNAMLKNPKKYSTKSTSPCVCHSAKNPCKLTDIS